MIISEYISIVTLNIHGLNAPIKRQRAADWIKIKTYLYAAYKRHTSDLKTQTKCEEMEKDISCKWRWKETWVSIFISDKVDFKAKSIIKSKNSII